MIYVTQGHEKGIGLEVYIKSLFSLPKKYHHYFKLICFHKSLEQTLKTLNFSYDLNDNDLITPFGIIHTHNLLLNSTTESLSCLQYVFNKINPQDSWLTLPTSKDQLIDQDAQYLGHTDWFRKQSNLPVAMNFIFNNLKILLLTDHIPLKNVPQALSTQEIISKVELSLKSAFYSNIEKVIFSGINPHAGENSLLGKEEENIVEATQVLSKKFPHITFSNPIPADSIFITSNSVSKSTLYIFSYHDQALSMFKAQYGTIGINLSTGLNFLRYSPDHGTAFSLYGKNTAQYQGMTYLLRHLIHDKEKKEQ